MSARPGGFITLEHAAVGDGPNQSEASVATDSTSQSDPGRTTLTLSDPKPESSRVPATQGESTDVPVNTSNQLEQWEERLTLEAPNSTSVKAPAAKSKVKKVILKLGNPPASLEGRNGEEIENSPKPTTSTQTEPIRLARDNKISKGVDGVNKDSSLVAPNMDLQSHMTCGIGESQPNIDVVQDLLETPLLTEVISIGDPSTDIHAHVINCYNEDRFFSKILDTPSTFKNFEVSNG
ncbi:hypothetical protein BDR05DRAFT_948286 [Suillus weaverae]|nr:hypothetical protein BDR05DRAFT_948286 [Suillus weaverae]